MKHALLASLISLPFALAAYAEVIVQAPDTNYVVIEAEAYELDDRNDEFTGWTVLDASDPQEYELHGGVGVIELPPADTNPSGGLAMFDQVGGGDFADQLGYQINFATQGTYYMYLRYSMFDVRELGADNYGNEDSIYIPYTSFDEDPAGEDPEIRNDRIGYIALGSAIGVDGDPATPSNGCRDPLADPFDEEPLFLSQEECEAEGFHTEDHWEGQYHWKPVVWNFDGEHANYDIDETGVVLDYAIASRERGMAMDVFILSQDSDLTSEELDALAGIGVVGVEGDFDNSGVRDAADLDLLAAAMQSGDGNFDLTGDGAVDFADRNYWVTTLSNTFIGDSNFDGEFNSSDFVAVFGAAKYETNQPATWSEGDWNGDGVFSSSDFVAAFDSGGYETGARDGGLQVVPEPSGILLICIGLIANAIPTKGSPLIRN